MTPTCSFNLPKGAPMPAPVSRRNWAYQFDVRDPGSFQRERIETQGYFMYRISDHMAS